MTHETYLGLSTTKGLNANCTAHNNVTPGICITIIDTHILQIHTKNAYTYLGLSTTKGLNANCTAHNNGVTRNKYRHNSAVARGNATRGVCVCVCVCVCMYVCVCVCVYVCVLISSHIHTYTHTYIHTHIHTYIHT
jgi:hypothetical protein